MNLKPKQQGVIFLAMVLVLLVAGGAFALGALNNRQSSELARDRELYSQMDLAKEALLAYAAYSYHDFSTFPGLLPCPDFNNDGASDANCDPSSMDSVGRLPEYVELSHNDDNGRPARLYLNNAYANIDQQFWYAVSPNFVYTSTNPVSSNGFAAGTLTLDEEDDIVAVIIAPGETLGQNRAQNPFDYAEYLEGGNGSGSEFWSSYDANPDAFNDIVIGIKRSEIRDKGLYEFVGENIAARLHAYRSSCNFYPRSLRSANCSISLALNVSGNANAFRNAINTGSNTPTWMRETSYGGYNWITSTNNAMTYNYNYIAAPNVASFDLRYTPDPTDQTDTGCLRFSLSYSLGVGTTTQSTC